MMKVIVVGLMMLGVACGGSVGGPEPTSEPCPTPAPLPEGPTVQFDDVVQFTGSQGMMALECAQRGAHGVVGGWCEVSEGGHMFADQEYQRDGWTCVANIDEGARITLKLHLVCLK